MTTARESAAPPARGSRAAAAGRASATPARLAFDRAGTGPPLVLLHPLGADRHVWRPVLPRLTPHRDTIALDLPGFGGSPPLPDQTPNPRALAAAVAGRLVAMGFGDSGVHVAGNSLGGWVALELALRGVAASVTAIAPAGLWPRPLPARPETARRVARVALLPGFTALMHAPALRRAALLGTVAHPERVPPADAAGLVRAYARAPGFTAVNGAMRAGVFTDLLRVRVPLTLVWPENDRMVARVDALPAHARVVDLPDCGHIPMWDDPAAVAAALLEGSEHPLRSARG